MIPTYKEADNVIELVERLEKVNIDADILFIDDNSPDGTGTLLDECAKKYKNITVHHRPFKQGIGTAHKSGIAYAYAQKCYTHLITMDGDFTHPPEDIPKLLEYSGDYDVVIGGRHAQKSSLEGWSAYRKLLTYTGHQFTSKLLRLPYDATSAFRIYRIDRIPETTFWLAENPSYPFFFESLCVLNENKHSIYDVPVVLPPRVAGSSKLNFGDMVDCLLLVITLGWIIRTRPYYLKDYIDPVFQKWSK